MQAFLRQSDVQPGLRILVKDLNLQRQDQPGSNGPRVFLGHVLRA